MITTGTAPCAARQDAHRWQLYTMNQSLPRHAARMVPQNTKYITSNMITNERYYDREAEKTDLPTIFLQVVAC